MDTVQRLLNAREFIEQRIEKDWYDESILRAAAKVLVINASLGQLWATAKFDYETAYTNRKVEYAKSIKKYKDMGMTVKEAEANSEVDVAELRGLENSLERDYLQLKNLHNDMDRVVSIVQSLNKLNASERYSTGLQDSLNQE